MDDFQTKMQKMYDYYGVKNDNQLSIKLGYTSNSAIHRWRKERKIPDKYLLIISKNIDTINSNTNSQLQSSADNPKLQSEVFKEFLELFKEYGNDKILLPVIDKLKEIERISKE